MPLEEAVAQGAGLVQLPFASERLLMAVGIPPPVLLPDVVNPRLDRAEQLLRRHFGRLDCNPQLGTAAGVDLPGYGKLDSVPRFRSSGAAVCRVHRSQLLGYGLQRRGKQRIGNLSRVLIRRGRIRANSHDQRFRFALVASLASAGWRYPKLGRKKNRGDSHK